MSDFARRGPPGGFGGGMGQLGGGFTRFGKGFAIALFALYLAQLIAGRWMGVVWLQELYLGPLGQLPTSPWQLLSHPLALAMSDPISVLLEIAMLWFFAAPVEKRLGTRGFLLLYLGTPVAVALPGLFLTDLILGPGLHGGLMVSSIALLTAFVVFNRDAQILLFFVLPIQAIWLLLGTAGIIALTILARTNPSGIYELLAMGLVYAALGGLRRGDLRRVRLRYEEWKLKRRLSKLRVVPGGRGDDDPMYH